ncbi:hypothetical protein OK016_08285 [Vibrio chagasii]|nr:hypothetical protein [Vibrio chagasii]
MMVTDMVLNQRNTYWLCYSFDQQWSGLLTSACLRLSQYDGSYVDYITGAPVRSYKEAEVQNSATAAGVKYSGSELKSDFLVNYQNQDKLELRRRKLEARHRHVKQLSDEA